MNTFALTAPESLLKLILPNELLSTLLKPVEKLMDDSPVHPKNAYLPMLTTSSILTVFRRTQLAKDLKPTAVTPPKSMLTMALLL